MQRVEAGADDAVEGARGFGLLERSIVGALAGEVLGELPLEAGLLGGGDFAPADPGLVRLHNGAPDVGGESRGELEPALLAGVLPRPQVRERKRGRSSRTRSQEVSIRPGL